MNYCHHNGTVTCDMSAQVMAYCNLDDSCDGILLLFGVMSTLDAPDWLNTGHMVDNGDHVQFQQHCLRGSK